MRKKEINRHFTLNIRDLDWRLRQTATLGSFF